MADKNKRGKFEALSVRTERTCGRTYRLIRVIADFGTDYHLYEFVGALQVNNLGKYSEDEAIEFLRELLDRCGVHVEKDEEVEA